MCGIFVAFNHNGIAHLPARRLRAAIAKVGHRGPDNLGYFAQEACFLGHTRLTILDLDAVSNQPFRFGDLSLTYNGEVFNYQELREELRALGHSFETESDTEVVIHAFAEWGVESFSRLNGMWALAIYDAARRELVVSRDRFGQKPLFLSKAGDDVFFASEFQELAGLVANDIDFELIQMFLKEGTYEGDGRTFLASVQEFPKAHYLRISTDGAWESKPYWRYPVGKIERTTPDTLAAFSDLLSDAVRLRLRSDVPFGLLVSGCVDSTLVAAYARQHSGGDKPIPAFTFSSRDAHDEREFAEAVAERLNLDLHVRYQEQEPSEYKARLAALVRHLGRGHSSPAIVSVDYLYESVGANGVRVALDGQGADELLAGYKNYFVLVIPWYLMRGQFRQAWLAFKDQLHFGFVSSVLLFLRNNLPPSLRKVMRYVYGYEPLFRHYRGNATPRWMEAKPVPAHANLLNRHLIWHHNLGLENLLYYGDIVAMRSSVENRSPFMDHRLVEFAFRHDDKLKLNDAIDKYVLRNSAAYEPFRDVLERDKVGFSSDIRPATKASMIADLRRSPILDWPIFSDRMRAFVTSEEPKRSKYERFLFRLYQVHLWNEIFIERTEESIPSPPQL
ncbi:MAG: asparagine synthase (glutamine-hydrolyzing) [Gemmatimonadota bacterium]|nr:asparagine synthase (glutamine-hydrolyzing) [Gemmatimonadota bacterium]